MKLLTRRGVLSEAQGSTCMADNDGDSDEARTFRPLRAAACTCRIAFGPRAGQKVLTVHDTMPQEAGFNQTLCTATSTGSVCTLPCAAALTTAKRSNNCAATSPWPTNGCNAPPRAPAREPALQAA